MISKLLLLLRYLWKLIQLDIRNLRRWLKLPPPKVKVTDESLWGLLYLYREYRRHNRVQADGLWQISLATWADSCDCDVVTFCSEYHKGEIEVSFPDDGDNGLFIG